MIFFGEKYKFTNLELERLNNISSKIVYIKYKDIPDSEIIKEFSKHIKKHKKVILNTKAKVPDLLIKYLTRLELNGIKYYTIENFLEKYLMKCYIPDDNTNLHYLNDIRGYSFVNKIQKTMINLIGVIFLLPFLSVFYYITKSKIKKQSPGDIYFKQERVGLGNIEFECIKFRSMQQNAEKDGVKFAKRDDNRVFAWGKIIRKTRIDELPQIFNILKGSMDLIGPRPERSYWIENYFEKDIPYYNLRHIVKPGITGWAQVMYPYGDNTQDARQKLMYDLYYIKYWNLILELKIIYKTFIIILTKKGT